LSRTFAENEIAELKRLGFAAAGSSRSRILSVLDILLGFTNENEGISASEIARVICVCSGKATSENAVLKDLHQIRESRPMGLEIAVPEHGENIGFRAIKKPLSSEEAVLVSDVLRTSAFISKDQKDDLCAKVLRFASDSKIDESIETVFVDEKAGKGSAFVLDALRVASHAIKRNERVSFKRQNHLMNGFVQESILYEEDPVAIVFSYGRYYLETCHLDKQGSASPYFHRIDDVVGMLATGKPISDQEAVNQLRVRVVADTRHRIDMYGAGEVRTLFLKVSGSHAKYVYERFGHDIEFCHVDERDRDNVIGYVCVKVLLSSTLFRWLFGMRGAVEIAEPKGERWVRSFPGLFDVDLPMLQSDYRIALTEYSDMLSAATAAINPAYL